MSESPTPPNNPSPRKDPNAPEPGVNWRGMMFIGLAILLVTMLFLRGSGTPGTNFNYEEFESIARGTDNERELVRGGEQYPLRLVRSPSTAEEFITGFYRLKADGADVKPRNFRTTVNVELNKDDIAKLRQETGIILNPYTENSYLAPFLFNYGPLILLVLIIFFFFRQQMKMAGRGAMSFGKSRAKLLTADKNKVTFKDVAGVEEAKDEVWEIVEFLKDPKKFQRLGGRIPKGILMVGPPGTGKTLLARAIAGEADVPFFSISGSDFVEMFVGVGASRVRDMFEAGKKSAPCLIFIDEIDAVGRHRGHGLGGGHDEREQTLNALLVEMDGFDTQEGIIIIAATNRPDVLDPALLRPGRFDRQVYVNLPDVKGREEILKVHSRKIRISDDVDLYKMARATPGFSGADLANLINEAALLAARRGKKAVTMDDMEEARDKVRWGKERRSLVMTEKDKRLTAWHEAGHAILITTLEHADPLHKVTIIPRGPYLGAAFHLPKDDRLSMSKLECLDALVVTMGGRVAEEITFGDVTNGAAGDIRQATHIARNMVCEWGMSEKLGMVEYGASEEPVFLARDMSSRRGNYSGKTAQIIDEEIKRIVDESYERAREILTSKRDKLDALANALLEFETLDAEQVKEVLEHGRLLNPPAPVTPPAPPPPSTGKTPPPSTNSKDEPDDGLPEFASAPA
jgi:cell division protease FtsH